MIADAAVAALLDADWSRHCQRASPGRRLLRAGTALRMRMGMGMTMEKETEEAQAKSRIACADCPTPKPVHIQPELAHTKRVVCPGLRIGSRPVRVRDIGIGLANWDGRARLNIWSWPEGGDVCQSSPARHLFKHTDRLSYDSLQPYAIEPVGRHKSSLH
jgi:hypothetical protein